MNIEFLKEIIRNLSFTSLKGEEVVKVEDINEILDMQEAIIGFNHVIEDEETKNHRYLDFQMKNN